MRIGTIVDAVAALLSMGALLYVLFTGGCVETHSPYTSSNDADCHSGVR
jgi:hypothetical protein